ncbi:MAG: type II toxin-antitoxin system VapC family toxin [Burkholderiales bacterium]|nr:type II toxin-antitoxin system VapC family toxin [Burkholderiales bacterium]
MALLHLPRSSHPRPRFAGFFQRAASGEVAIALSAITLVEVLAGPIGRENEVLAETYRAALTKGAGWTVMPVSEEIAIAAARFRARHRLRLPDAIQLATVVVSGAFALVTHDRDFRMVRDVRVIGGQ